jgi:hypothetical protein
MSKVDINALTSSQKDFILNSIALRDLSSKAVLEYQKLQEQAQKNGQPLDKKVLDEFRKQY